MLSAYLTENQQDILKGFSYSFIGWNILNMIVMNLSLPDKHLKREDMLDMRNRIVSFFHGTISMILSGYNTYFVHSQCGEHNSKFEEQLLMFSVGYFTYDMVAMAYFRILDKSMFIHHNICIIGMLMGLVNGYSGDVLIAALFVSEVSNPAMHVRMVLKHLGLRYSKSYETAELIYMSKYKHQFCY